MAILILLAANLILVALLVPNRMAQAEAEANLRTSLTTLYASQGVLLEKSAIPNNRTLYALQLAADTSAQVRAATALLGEQPVAQSDPAGWLSSFRSASGSCSVGRHGVFQARLTGLDKTPEQVLTDMGFAWTGMLQQERDVQAVQTVLEVPIYGSGLTLTYEGRLLTAVDGVFFCGADTPIRVSEEACMTAADALVLFLDRRYDLGWVGGAVLSLEQGYLRVDTASAANVQLTPVWRLVTDTDSFYVDGLTGELTPIA
jgi:hypothetical protein